MVTGSSNIFLFILDYIICLPITIIRLGLIYCYGSRYNMPYCDILDIMNHAKDPKFNMFNKKQDTVEKSPLESIQETVNAESVKNPAISKNNITNKSNNNNKIVMGKNDNCEDIACIQQLTDKTDSEADRLQTFLQDDAIEIKSIDDLIDESKNISTKKTRQNKIELKSKNKRRKHTGKTVGIKQTITVNQLLIPSMTDSKNDSAIKALLRSDNSTSEYPINTKYTRKASKIFKIEEEDNNSSSDDFRESQLESDIIEEYNNNKEKPFKQGQMVQKHINLMFNE